MSRFSKTFMPVTPEVRSDALLGPPSANTFFSHRKSDADISPEITKTVSNLLFTTIRNQLSSSTQKRPKHTFFKTVQDGERRSSFIGPKHKTQKSNKRLLSFHSVVDENLEDRLESRFKDEIIGAFLESLHFRLTVLVLIILNTIFIGIQTDHQSAQGGNSIFDIIDLVFLTLFMLEIIIKWAQNFVMFWKDGWNIFDLAVVAISALSSVLNGMAVGKSTRVFRIFRVLRAFRTLRILNAFRGLRAVVDTFVQSLLDLTNIFFLIFILMFIFSILGVQLFSTVIPNFMGDLGTSLFTCWFFMTQEGWVQIWSEASSVDSNYSFSVGLYSVMAILMLAFIFGHIISGITVTNWLLFQQEADAENLKAFKVFNAGKNQEETKYAETVEINDVDPEVWSRQVPFEKFEGKNMSLRAIENYLLVNVAMERNHQEFLEQFHALKEVYTEMNELTLMLMGDQMLPDSASHDGSSSEEEAEVESADVLSTLITKKHLVGQLKKAATFGRKMLRERLLGLDVQNYSQEGSLGTPLTSFPEESNQSDAFEYDTLSALGGPRIASDSSSSSNTISRSNSNSSSVLKQLDSSPTVPKKKPSIFKRANTVSSLLGSQRTGSGIARKQNSDLSKSAQTPKK